MGQAELNSVEEQKNKGSLELGTQGRPKNWDIYLRPAKYRLGILGKLPDGAPKDPHKPLQGFLVPGQVPIRASSLTQEPNLGGIGGILLHGNIAGDLCRTANAARLHLHNFESVFGIGGPGLELVSREPDPEDEQAMSCLYFAIKTQ